MTEKLESESDILWTQRKKIAEEKGRIAETKLTFPLALLLFSFNINYGRAGHNGDVDRRDRNAEK